MILFQTANPADLLEAFNEAIAKGHHKDGITTWIRDGDDYTHAAPQWTRKAYFRPHVEAGRLVFNIVKNQAQNVSVVAYGFYHGHLLETFLNHFDRKFAAAGCTPLCDSGDYCQAA